MYVVVFLALLYQSAATSVVYLSGESLDLGGVKIPEHTLQKETLVHVSFPQSCETHCMVSFLYEVDAGDPMDIRVYIPALSDSKLVVNADNSAALTPYSSTTLDSYTLSVYEGKFRVYEQTATHSKMVIVTVLCSSLEGRFAVISGGPIEYSFWQLSLGFGALVQSNRVWTKTFVFPYILGVLTLLYFLAWPLRTKRPHVWTILSSLAYISLLAWVIDAFWHCFIVMQSTSERSVISFALHILSNLFWVAALVGTETSDQIVRRWVYIAIAGLSLLIGGAGLYAAPALLLFDVILLRRTNGKFSSLICKSV